MEPMSGARSRHWDAIYQSKGPSRVSWYQAAPTVAIELIEGVGVAPSAPVLDIGGGASMLVDELLARGFTDISVLDVSESALHVSRARLGADARRVAWIREDLLSGWVPSKQFGLWHDRAVFHFLVTEEERDRYRVVLASALAAGGAAIIATFASDGPERCSGLPVARYGADELVAALGGDFKLIASRREEHRTPAGVVQPFTWVAARRG